MLPQTPVPLASTKLCSLALPSPVPPPDIFSPAGSPPPPSLLQRLCSRFRLSVLALGLNVLLLVAVCVIGSQSTQLQVELQTLKETFNNFSSSTLMEVRVLISHGISSNDKVTSLGAKLEKQQQDLKGDHTTLLLHLKHFPGDLRILACQMAFIQSNRTECCPISWLEYGGSCYWFSHTGKTWVEAEKYCQLENAHLVVINSREEQKFILQRTNPFQTWMGLTDSDGSWKWVDGTDYGHGYRNWGASHPDDWRGHELGGREDCAKLHPDGRWNVDMCQEVHRWACEMRRDLSG